MARSHSASVGAGDKPAPFSLSQPNAQPQGHSPVAPADEAVTDGPSSAPLARAALLDTSPGITFSPPLAPPPADKVSTVPKQQEPARTVRRPSLTLLSSSRKGSSNTSSENKSSASEYGGSTLSASSRGASERTAMAVAKDHGAASHVSALALVNAATVKKAHKVESGPQNLPVGSPPGSDTGRTLSQKFSSSWMKLKGKGSPSVKDEADGVGSTASSPMGSEVGSPMSQGFTSPSALPATKPAKAANTIKGFQPALPPKNKDEPPLPIAVQQSKSPVKGPIASRDSSTPVPSTLEQKQAHAARRMAYLTKAGFVLDSLALAGKIAGGWLPYVAQATALVQSMYGGVIDAGACEVSAWRMVERCADVVGAVQSSLAAVQGTDLGLQMESNLERLLGTLHESDEIIAKLATRSFFKLYLKSDELDGAISRATTDLEDCVNIFQLQASIATAAWQAQNDRDRGLDIKLLLHKMAELQENDDRMWQAMRLQNSQTQDAIRTLTRTLDAVLRAQQDSRQLQRGTRTSARIIAATPGMLEATASTTSMTQIGEVPASAVAELTKALAPTARRHPRTSFRAAVWATVAAAELGDRVGISVAGQFDKHIRFLERGLDVLLRRSGPVGHDAPEDWTVTPWEITHGPQIASGFYSTVYCGTWQNQAVAIKQLNENASKRLFLEEVRMWRPLLDANVLEFWGASSTESPPYFLMSPFMANGDVVAYLRTDAGKAHSKATWLLEIASGMQYLHSRDVLHGDLKGSNVLISNSGHALICDFGLAHLKLDIARMSGDIRAGRGGMRWCAPERLRDGELTAAADVYAFAITMVEILSGGEVPYGHVEEEALRFDIQHRQKRPSLTWPQITPKLEAIIKRCWTESATERPTFEAVVPVLHDILQEELNATSEDGPDSATTNVTSDSSESFLTAGSGSKAPPKQQIVKLHSSVKDLPRLAYDEHSSSASSSSTSPVNQTTTPLDLSHEFDDRVASSYRRHLIHTFDDRLREALWKPTRVKLGDVGYLTREGGFHCLFNATEGPPTKVALPVRFLDEFSSVNIDSKIYGTRSVAQRGLEIVTNALTHFSSSKGQISVKRTSRQVKFPLRSQGSHRQSALIVDEAEVKMFHNLEPARDYLLRNADSILQEYGIRCGIGRQDLVIIVGALFVTDWAMMVASADPFTTANFNVHADKELGQPWGTWATERDTSASLERGWNPVDLQGSTPKLTCKASSTSAVRDAVLLARLKFPSGNDAAAKPLLC